MSVRDKSKRFLILGRVLLREIDRVLRPGGLLIAPNFVEHKGTMVCRIWSGILVLAASVLSISGLPRNT